MQQLLISIAPRDVDLVSGWLFELGVEGFEERESGSSAELVLYSDDPRELAETRAQLEKLANTARLSQKLSFEMRELDDSYRHAWVEHLKPAWLTDEIVIQPASLPPPEGTCCIVYQPELAFGTGSHATTQLAARAVVRCLEHNPGARVLDVGTGNGVLGFVALLTGADHVLGIDVDLDAVRAAQVNAELNRCQDRAQFRQLPLADVRQSFELVVANIDARTIANMAPMLARLTTRDLVVTGFLEEQRADVEPCYLAEGLIVTESQTLEDWCMLRFTAELTKSPEL